MVWHNSLSIIFLFSPIKMSLDPSQLKTPPRPRKPIECVSYRQKNQKGRKKQQENDVPFSFRGIEKDEILKGYLSQLDQQQQTHGRSREEYTEKKLKLVSAMPFQKTEKKKYLKLMSSHPRHQEQSNEDFESLIADEQYDGTDKGKTQQVRASLDYFAQELGLMNDQIRKSGIHLQIENQIRIVMLSQKNSECNLTIEQPQAIKRRSYELSPTQKIRRKIMLSGTQPEQVRKETSGEAYRYCIGCQFPIIQTSITKHEQQCPQFQLVFEMDYQQIADFLKDMIGELSKRIDHIQQSLTFDDLKNLKICTDGLLRESQSINLSGQPNPSFDLKYQSLHQLNQKWVSFAQQICKLNWFIKLRQSVKRSQGK